MILYLKTEIFKNRATLPFSMTVQYNVSVKVLEASQEWRIQNSLQGYRVFTDRSGNLEDTCFSRENLPYVGELIVVKTLKQEAAQTAYDVLGGIEGLLVLPITECSYEEDKKNRVKRIADQQLEKLRV